jgi:hypothetical protein
MTRYVVLRANTDTDDTVTSWVRLPGTAEAPTPGRAISAMREDVAGDSEVDAVYAAVPARSWKPERRWTERKPINRSQPVDA